MLSRSYCSINSVKKALNLMCQRAYTNPKLYPLEWVGNTHFHKPTDMLKGKYVLFVHH